MKNITFKKSLGIVLAISLGSTFITGCVKKPTYTPPTTVKTPEKKLSAPELKIYARLENTSPKRVKEVSPYDYTVKINNLNNSSAQITLMNKGESDLKISNIKFHDNSEKLFSLASSCGDTIKAKKECKLKVSFNGKYKGRFTSIIRIDSNSNGTYVKKIAKIHVIAEAMNRKTGLINPIKIKDNTTPSIPMAKLDFRKENDVQYAQIKNNGVDDIEIDSINLVGESKDSFIVEQECPRILKVGHSCEVKVTYTKKTSKLALSYLVLDSDGVLSPSNRIRLKGRPFPIAAPAGSPEILKLASKDDMTIKITEVVTNKSVEVFAEDHSAVKPIFYFRTMYQKIVDPKFKEYYETLISYYFKKNGYKVTRDASKADKIANIYPKISIASNGKGAIQIKSNIRVNLVTKASSKSQNEEVDFSMTILANNYTDKYFVYTAASSKLNSFMFNLLGLDE